MIRSHELQPPRQILCHRLEIEPAICRVQNDRLNHCAIGADSVFLMCAAVRHWSQSIHLTVNQQATVGNFTYIIDDA